MALVIIGLIVITIAAIYGFVKAVNYIFDPIINRLDKKRARLRKDDNPYIQMHRLKFENDAMYDEYLVWLNENGGDLPFDKWVTQEEVEFEKKLNHGI